MRNIEPIKKQTLSSREKYRQYLSEQSEPSDKLHNKSNIFDDLNSVDKAMMKEAKLYLHRSNIESNKPIKEKTMPKDRGRKAIKKPKQVKVKPEARYG
jgi:hypothetical protein